MEGNWTQRNRLGPAEHAHVTTKQRAHYTDIQRRAKLMNGRGIVASCHAASTCRRTGRKRSSEAAERACSAGTSTAINLLEDGGRDELEGELSGGLGVDGLGMSRLQQGAAARGTKSSFTRLLSSLTAAASSLSSSSVAPASGRQGAKKGGAAPFLH